MTRTTSRAVWRPGRPRACRSRPATVPPAASPEPLGSMASPLPLILLPPSEGKALGGTGAPWSAGAMALDLDDERRRVIGALATAMRGGEPARAKLLGVTGSGLAAATAADRRVTRSPTLPAIERYTGVLYDALDHGSLTAAQRKRLHASIVIVSGLWGAVMPADPVPAYRL